MTGREAAEQILHRNGIYDVQVIHIPGNLTDHYNPGKKTLGLSDTVYNSTSVAAIGVAAHECGHAMQDANDYSPLRIRAALVPAANLGSQLCWPLIIIGLLLGGSSVLLNLGILLFLPGSAVSAGDPACGVRCFPQGGDPFGFHRHPGRTGSGTDQKGPERSGPYLCGGSGCFHPSASPLADIIRQPQE